ncbi:hypothetical protein ZIOFF_073503 [Zingiber officinale]|uniref:Exocyst subunit Exo70 family protein n=2 Tax=Zingiber officinale TaxID=94328 RepID=A0A8J5EAA7_ZINOF|nr:hypothetical protein ZIOFF_073503 [Zingiber officinale]
MYRTCPKIQASLTISDREEKIQWTRSVVMHMMASHETWSMCIADNRTALQISIALLPSFPPRFVFLVDAPRFYSTLLPFVTNNEAPMERNHPHLPQKCSSFASIGDEKHREMDRNLSLGNIKLVYGHEKKERQAGDTIREEGEGEEATENSNAEQTGASLSAISDDIDKFIALLLSVDEGGERPEIPESTINKFVELVEKEIAKYESGEAKWTGEEEEEEEPSLLHAIERVYKLTEAASSFSSETNYFQTMNRAGVLLHQAMCLLEDEFYALLQDPHASKPDPGSCSTKVKGPISSAQVHDSPEPTACESPLPYPPETVQRLRMIARAMVGAGYSIECCQVFAMARRNAFDAALPRLGLERVSIEDVSKMAWESLEGDVGSWIKAFQHATTAVFPAEHALCEAVFAGHRDVSDRLFCAFARAAFIQLLTFPEAVSMTKRSAEKLFKVLDIYETLRDAAPSVDALLPNAPEAGRDQGSCAEWITGPKTEIMAVKCRIGEAAAAIFCDLESSIKADNNKMPVPGGAVHPLTRYVMNYLKYACEYRATLEQVFREHKKSDNSSAYDEECSRNGAAENEETFSVQLLEVMNLLHSNLEAKSRLYKDLALCNIFMMNNGRYVAKKVKGSPEIHQILGENWYRRRSSELRQYHKNYQRETWSRVLTSLRDEGLTTHGRSGSGVAKPVLKERFKSFNAMIDEIHKTQSAWVVSDEQMQSELRVSVSAVIVPAYRSFLGRFSQHLDPGRQTEKYIKFAPDDLESLIDGLFEGNQSATPSKRRS